MVLQAKEVEPMRRLLWILAVAVFASGITAAGAGPSDLDDGVFICHYDPAMVASVPDEGYCQQYLDGFAIASCGEQNPSIDVETPVVWFILAAWGEAKEWCGVEFGFGDFDPNDFTFTASGGCGPTGVIEIPMDGWPGPNLGTALVTTGGLQWEGDFQPVYYFEGYNYYGVTALMPLGPNPDTGLGGCGNCLTPPVQFPPFCYGTMGLMQAGVECCPPTGDPTGACCIADDIEYCQILTEADCIAAGGEYLGDDTICDGACPATGACCQAGGACDIMTQSTCETVGGDYQGDGVTCVTADCPIIWACCIAGECFLMTEEECDDGGVAPWRTWFPEEVCGEGGIDCTTPIEETSWGQIKAIYR